MAKTNESKVKIGYALRINRAGAKGLDNWERVGFTFNTRAEAEAFRLKSYSGVKKYTVMGVRVNKTPLVSYSKEGK